MLRMIKPPSAGRLRPLPTRTSRLSLGHLNGRMCAVPTPARQPEPSTAQKRECERCRRMQNGLKGRFRHQQCSQVPRRDHQEDQSRPAAHPGPEACVQERLLEQTFVSNRPAALYQVSDLVLIRRGRISNRFVGQIPQPVSTRLQGGGHLAHATSCAGSGLHPGRNRITPSIPAPQPRHLRTTRYARGRT